MRFTSPLTNSLATAGLLGTGVLHKGVNLANGNSETFTKFLPAKAGISYRIWLLSVGWIGATGFNKTGMAAVTFYAPVESGLALSVVWPHAPTLVVGGLVCPSAGYLANMVGGPAGLTWAQFEAIYSEVQTGG